MNDGIIKIGNIYYGGYRAGFAGNVVSPGGVCPSLTTMGGAIGCH